MTMRRSNGRYYIKRQVPGIGNIYRSLRTDRKRTARKREDMILSLAQQGQQEVIRAWLDDELNLPALQESYETGSVHELLSSARRDDVPLKEACDAALQDKSPDVKDSTLSRYDTGLGHFRAFCGEDTRVHNSLTTNRIQQFKAHRLDVDEVAKETVNNDLIAVSILCTYALRQGWIDQRPEIKKFPTEVRISYLEPDALTTYMAELRPHFRPYMKLLLGTGLRRGEAEALAPSDLRLNNGEARAAVRDSKTPTGVRTVFLPRWVANPVQRHIEEQNRGDREPIFQTPRRTVNDEHYRARERIDRPEYTIHDHRHTAAVHLARAGMPLNLLQQQLGHANIDQTMKYARFHPDYGDVREYFDRVGKELGLGGERASETGNSSGNIPPH